MITPSMIISILIVDKLVKSKTMGVGLIFERMSDSQVSLVMILMVSPRSANVLEIFLPWIWKITIGIIVFDKCDSTLGLNP